MDTWFYLVVFTIKLILPMIPANIAKYKHRSFWLFYVFGTLFFLPTTVIALCMGDPYDDELASGGGIAVIVIGTITAYLTPKLVDFNNIHMTAFVENHISLWGVTEMAELSAGWIIALGLVMYIGAFIVALIAGLLVALILWKPLCAITRFINDKILDRKIRKIEIAEDSYQGKNKRYIDDLNNVIPFAKKYRLFFKKRDRLAQYKKLNIVRILKITLPLPLLLLYALSPIKENFGGGEVIWKAAGILFVVLLLLSKPIAMLKYRKSLKYDAIDAQNGYTENMSILLPELAPEDLRYLKLRNMRIILKMDLTNDINIAAYYSELLEKGKSMAKVIAMASVPVAAVKSVVNYSIESAKDAYMPK